MSDITKLSNEDILFKYSESYWRKEESCCGCGDCFACDEFKVFGEEVMRRLGGGSFDAVAKWRKDLP